MMEIDPVELARYIRPRARALLKLASSIEEMTPSSAELRAGAAIAEQLCCRLRYLARAIELDIASDVVGFSGGNRETK